ncbi:MAG: hypothetical protein EXR79_06765 [Myxococcales bacterium]|nr:hypothetical protein [Myxococcales bacterium]
MSAWSRVRWIAQGAWRGLRAVLFAGFAVVSVAGVIRASTVKGVVEDRRAELRRLQQQLAEQQARGEELESSLVAFKARPDVREQVIRRELGMLKDGERVYTFR